MTSEGQPPTQRYLEDLVRANAESNETMHRLVENVRHDAEMRERKIGLLEEGLRGTQRLLWLVSAVLLLLIGLSVVNAANLSRARRQAVATAQVARAANGTYALLLDCLNQRGECGSKNTASNKALLDDVKRYQLTVAYCARLHPQPADPDAQAFLKCVADTYPGGPSLTK